MAPDIDYQKSGYIATITLNRPQALNALTRDMMDRWLPELWQGVKADKDVRVVIFTAAGERAFCSGRDLKEAADPKAAKAKASGYHQLRLTARQNGVEQPVITAVNGICAGGALEFIVDSDIVIASENASFTNPGVSVGTVVAYPGIMLSRGVPLSSLNRLMLTGKHERMSAQRAYELGIVTEVVPLEGLQEAARSLAEKIARNSPMAVRAMKKALQFAAVSGLDDAFEHARSFTQAAAAHPDIVEGARAFVEKREPRWHVD